MIILSLTLECTKHNTLWPLAQNVCAPLNYAMEIRNSNFDKTSLQSSNVINLLLRCIKEIA